jgi:hypothetical protein
VTDVDDDPTSPDGDWLVHDGTNSNTDCRVSLVTPSGTPTTGAGLQTLRALIRKNASGGNATDWSLALWESGAQVAVLATGTTTSLTGEVVSGTWDASSLADGSGAGVELRLEQTGGGSSGAGGNRRRIEIGAADWLAEVSVAASDGLSEGTSTAAAVGVSDAVSLGASAGVATATAEGTSDAVAEGVASGTSTAMAEAEAPASAVQPAARWTTVPFQRFGTDTIEVGVMAWHLDGIQKGTFSVNGGAGQDVTVRSWEKQRADHIWCYVLTIDLTQEVDGLLTVDCTVTADDVAETTYALEQLKLVNNNGGTVTQQTVWIANDGNDSTGDGTEEAPYLTVYKGVDRLRDDGNMDGGIIYCKAGTYSYGTYSFPVPTANDQEWCYIMPAPGLTKADVSFTGTATEGCRVKAQCFRDITFVTHPSSFRLGPRNARGGTTYLWHDDCAFTPAPDANGHAVDVAVAYNIEWTNIYGTDLYIEYSRYVFEGVPWLLARGCNIYRAGERPIRNAHCVVNCQFIETQRPTLQGSWSHPNLYETTTGVTNVILQHIRDRGGLLGFIQSSSTLTRIAIVDVVHQKITGGAGINGTMDCDLSGFWMFYVNDVDDVWKWTTPGSHTFTDCAVRCCHLDVINYVTSGTEEQLEAGIDWDHINWESTADEAPKLTPGTNLTFQESSDAFEDKVTGDFRVKTSGEGYEAGIVLFPLPSSPRGARNTTTPDVGAWLDATADDDGFGTSTAEAPASDGFSEGISAATAVGLSGAEAEGASAGTSTAAAVGLSDAISAGTSDGAATALGSALSDAGAAGIAAGTSTALAVADGGASDGFAEADSTATAEGLSDVVASGLSEGGAAASAEGLSDAISEGATAGMAGAIAEGASASLAIGTATGTGTAGASGLANATASGLAEGTSTATAESVEVGVSVGGSAGTATAAAVGLSQALADGVSSGMSSAFGVAVTGSYSGSYASHRVAPFLVAQAVRLWLIDEEEESRVVVNAS